LPERRADEEAAPDGLLSAETKEGGGPPQVPMLVDGFQVV